ncbi:MAG: urease accessory protein UreD [Rhodobacteraceae bacterium]|nr:urease accessory protein UreD [Paracoccaceae bacterium]
MNARAGIDQLQRSTGRARAAFDRTQGRAALRVLAQAGSAKAIILPGAGGHAEAVFLNTSGGLTGGDRLDYALELGPGCHVTATTQTAERIYRSPGGRARIGVTARVGAGAHLDWLPQETILFDRAAAQRRTEIDLAPDATCLMAETLVLGRAAMGEQVARVDFTDRRELRRGGAPLHLEIVRLTDAALGAGAAGLAGARAVASVVLAAPGAGDALGPVRAALGMEGVRGAASALAGRLVIRLMAADAWPLRRQMMRLLDLLRRAPLPRVWHC